MRIDNLENNWDNTSYSVRLGKCSSRVPSTDLLDFVCYNSHCTVFLANTFSFKHELSIP